MRPPAIASVGRSGSARGPIAATGRETEVARLARRGLTNRDIAERLGTSSRTVANQLQRVYEKLQIRDRESLPDL